ncbi:transcriptional regulator [Aestuariicella hydrocarbonica]|uniref:Transcriptional regulator n=1 Tax=Pseudomaricurvus hydrocarbonicus TaxID=1470433 RepID=A0A9E5JWR9_9GAMM|nr:winged helix-turn-helix transcriptional regulator [Aestuariicella hydrocarbonica]NHO65940.1 transcriptional regulator [Aestuariicella hydrocarbonica]
MGYNQFCPIAKGMEVLGEKWTLLIVRELIMGSTRFNEFQRGLPSISPTLLTKRLSAMEADGLLFKKRIPGQRGFEYFPTQACQDLFPVIEQIGIWGMQWARQQMTEDDFDLELLMLYLERSIQPDKLSGRETVIKFNFTDVKDYPNWWIVVQNGDVDVCVHDPGKEVDVYFNVCVRVMCGLWMGDISYRKAIADGALQLVGHKALTQNVTSWLQPSIFAGSQPASAILEPLL